MPRLRGKFEETFRLAALGWSASMIGEELGLSRTTIITRCAKAGVRLQGRPGNRMSEQWRRTRERAIEQRALAFIGGASEEA